MTGEGNRESAGPGQVWLVEQARTCTWPAPQMQDALSAPHVVVVPELLLQKHTGMGHVELHWRAWHAYAPAACDEGSPSSAQLPPPTWLRLVNSPPHTHSAVRVHTAWWLVRGSGLRQGGSTGAGGEC